MIARTPDLTEQALRSALGLCDYLISVWPEVGTLPRVQGTRDDVLIALRLYDGHIRLAPALAQALAPFAPPESEVRGE